MNDEQLQILIQAKDDASAVVEKVNKAIGSLSENAEKATPKTESLFASFVKGAITVEALETAGRAVLDFFKSTAEEAMIDQAAMVQLQRSVENMGMSWAKAQPALESYIGKQREKGFQDNVTSDSMQRLILVTGDLNRAQLLNGLAMDLARNKHIDLATATNAVAMATQGNARVLTQYGIKISATMTATEALNELHEKVKGSASDFAETAAGKMEILNAEWDHAKEKIGEEFLPALTKAASFVTDNLPKMTQAVTDFAVEFKKVGELITQILGLLGNLDKGLGAVFGMKNKGLISSFVDEMGNSLKVFGDAFDQGINGWNNALGKVNDTLDPTTKKAQEMLATFGDVSKMTDAQRQLFLFKQTAEAAGNSTDDFSKVLGTVPGDAKRGAEAIKKTDEAVKTFSKTLSDTQFKLGQTITDFMTKAAKSLDEYNAKITETQLKITRLNEDWSEQQKTFDEENSKRKKDQHQQVIDQFIQEQDKAKELQKQLESGNNTTDVKTGKNVAEQLDDQKKIIQEYLKQYATIDLEANQSRNESSLQKLQDKFKQENAVAQKQQDDKKKQYDRSLTDLQESLNKENEAFKKSKDTLLQETQTKYNDLQKAVSDGWDKVISTAEAKTASLKAIESQMNALKANIEAVSAATASNPSVQVPTLPIAGKKASGGPVEGGKAYLVGENGPEFFQPSTSGQIIPNNVVKQVTQTPNTPATIHILQGAIIHVTNEADENRLTKKISQELARIMQAKRIGLASAM